MGLGNAYVAMADDPTAVYWNPAGLDYIYQQSLTFFHASLPEGGLYDFFGYAYPTLDLGTFAIGIGRIGTGDIDQYDIAGQSVGSTFSYDNYRLYLSYGLKLPYNISAGLSIKVLRQGFYNISLVEYGGDVNATGVGMDLGILYKPEFSTSPLLRDWSIGLNVQNMFQPQLKLGDITDIIPLSLRFGLMRTIPISGTGAFNILLDLDKSSTTGLGIFFGMVYIGVVFGGVMLVYKLF